MEKENLALKKQVGKLQREMLRVEGESSRRAKECERLSDRAKVYESAAPVDARLLAVVSWAEAVRAKVPPEPLMKTSVEIGLGLAARQVLRILQGGGSTR